MEFSSWVPKSTSSSISISLSPCTLISLINVEVGINMKGGKKLMHNSNKLGVEGGKNLRNQ